KIKHGHFHPTNHQWAGINFSRLTRRDDGVWDVSAVTGRPSVNDLLKIGVTASNRRRDRNLLASR
ncbi:MAG: hypothetical protein OEL91_04525, partial [Burkholderiaceae bacterium]|nr:hypothetical protein [Burkholderiaceae bacterium]